MIKLAQHLKHYRPLLGIIPFIRTFNPTVDQSRSGVSNTGIWKVLRNLFCGMAAQSNPAWATKLKFDNLALKVLPVDESDDNRSRQVPGACFSLVKPTPVENPKLVCAAIPALQLLDISEEDIKSPEFAEFFSGNRIIPGSVTAAHCYCGHQFGYFSGQLGDGAAMYLGEIINKSGQRWEIQLKGAGLTPYSRSADGRKVLRSSIREFLCSEAIHHLGIPTTRAGSCVTSDSTVIRDIFYDGHPIKEQCTVVLRIAPTFIRFGSFEIFKSVDSETGRQGPSVGKTDLLHKLLDYTIETFYPEIWSQSSSDKKLMYIEFYKEIVRRTARMVAAWQCVGWCHGVLNTDNMSIVGVTIDYGPYGFLDKYDPDFICNASDDGGRYTYRKQPEICKWNCMKLGEAIKDAVPTSETRPHLQLFDEEFDQHYNTLMRKKLGLIKELPEDKDLVRSFLNTMHETGGDFTNCFRHLSDLPLPNSTQFEDEKQKLLNYLMSQSSSLEEMKRANAPRMDRRQLAMMMMVAEANPELLQALGRGSNLLEQELQRMTNLKKLEELSEQEIQETNKKAWNKWLNEYIERLRIEVENVEDWAALEDARRKLMNSVNPRFILRNYIAQNAITAAEKGDFSEVRRVLELLQSPYAEGKSLDVMKQENETKQRTAQTSGHSGATCAQAVSSYDQCPPAWAADLKVT